MKDCWQNQSRSEIIWSAFVGFRGVYQVAFILFGCFVWIIAHLFVSLQPVTTDRDALDINHL